jgi:hypothetical protein
MEIKPLKSNAIVLFLLLLLSCQKNDNWTKVLGIEGSSMQKIEGDNDNADVCHMDIYSISSNDIEDFEKVYKKINAKNAFQNQSNWTSIGWDYSNLDKRIVEFVYPNFIKNDLRKIIISKDYYYTYSYKGGINDLFAVQLYILSLKQKTIYYFEIIP